jgi:hypothetical protein
MADGSVVYIETSGNFAIREILFLEGNNPCLLGRQCVYHGGKSVEEWYALLLRHILVHWIAL